MRVRDIDFHVLESRDEFFGNKETLRTFLHLDMTTSLVYRVATHTSY
jgi:hypothetical protein